MCKADHFSLTAQALTDAFHVLRCLKNLIMAKKKKWGQNLSEVIIFFELPETTCQLDQA